MFGKKSANKRKKEERITCGCGRQTTHEGWDKHSKKLPHQTWLKQRLEGQLPPIPAKPKKRKGRPKQPAEQLVGSM